MQLTLAERYAMIGVLPVQGNFLTLKRLRELREALGLTEKEKEEFSVKEVLDADGTPTGALTWPPAVSKIEREIEVCPSMNAVIVRTLTELNKNEKLHVSQERLYEKFVEKAAESESNA